MAQGYTLDIQGLNSNDSTRIVGVTGLTLSGNSISVTANGGNTTVSLATAYNIRLTKGVTEFRDIGNTHTASGSGGFANHSI